MMLGSQIESALHMIGIDQRRVEQWLGYECRCKERIEKLDSLTLWAKRVLAGRVSNAAAYISKIIR